MAMLKRYRFILIKAPLFQVATEEARAAAVVGKVEELAAVPDHQVAEH